MGNTSRTQRVRSKLHQNDYEKCARKPDRQMVDRDEDEESSFMHDHMKDKHQDTDIDKYSDFKFQVTQGFRYPWTR